MVNHTFVIPAYKDSPYLEECLVSLINQNIKSEIKITTSTPSEHIRNIAQKHSTDVIINNNPEKGLVSVLGVFGCVFAYSQAKTKFVTLSHQDEVYEREYTETILNTLE